MSTPTWPGSLPSEWSIRTRYRRLPTTVETEMDSGLPKARKRHSAVLAHVDTYIRLTGTQVAAFETWYDDTIGGGALAWTRAHPVTGVTATFQFRNDEMPPEWTPVVSDETPGLVEWEATLAMRVLP